MKWVYGSGPVGREAKPSGWQDEAGWGWQERPTITVWEEDAGAVRTGLLDVNRAPLYRWPRKEPIGFRKRCDNET